MFVKKNDDSKRKIKDKKNKKKMQLSCKEFKKI